MKLDITSGILEFDHLSLQPWMRLEELLSQDKDNQVVLLFQNGIYSTYNIRLVENGEYGMSLNFESGLFKYISLSLGLNYHFPPYQVTEEERKLLESKLTLLGGARSYHWGTIGVYENKKGGQVSIGITFTKK